MPFLNKVSPVKRQLSIKKQRLPGVWPGVSIILTAKFPKSICSPSFINLSIFILILPNIKTNKF